LIIPTLRLKNAVVTRFYVSIIENMFQKFEGEWAGAFRNFNNIEGITDDELAQTIFQIMTFIAFQNSRTLKVYDAQKGFDGFFRNYLYENSYSAASANELLNKYLPEGYNLMEAPINVSFSTIDIESVRFFL